MLSKLSFAKIALFGFYDRMTSAPKTAEISVIRELHNLWNIGNLKRIPQIYSSKFIAHMPKGWAQSEFRGHEGVKEAILRIRNAFPDWHEQIEDIVVDQGKVVTRYVSTGTHKGRFIGVEPTGRTVKVDEISIYHLDSGLVVEQWCLTDDLSLAQQLGLLSR